MSDRLSDLRRQRALAAEQLARLNREIAVAGSEAPALPSAPPSPTGPAGPAGGSDLPEADKILAEFRSEAESSPAKLRRGCIWSFAAGMTFLILGIVAIYWLRYR